MKVREFQETPKQSFEEFFRLKSVRRIIKAHEVQLVNYFVATRKPVGLILNCGERKIEIKRKVSDSSDRINDKQDLKKISCLSCYPV